MNYENYNILKDTSTADIWNAIFKARICLSWSHGGKSTPIIFPIHILGAPLIPSGHSAPSSGGNTSMNFDRQIQVCSDVYRTRMLDIIHKL